MVGNMRKRNKNINCYCNRIVAFLLQLEYKIDENTNLECILLLIKKIIQQDAPHFQLPPPVQLLQPKSLLIVC